MQRIIPRERGTAIVQNKQGKILIVSEDNCKFVLPGGSIEGDEGSFEGTIRELREETGMVPIKAEKLFKSKSNILWHNNDNKKTYSTYHTILFVKPNSFKIKPNDDVRYYYWVSPLKIDEFNIGKKHILKSHIKIIKKYMCKYNHLIKKWFNFRISITKYSNLKLKSNNFSIPTGATINGIVVQVEKLEYFISYGYRSYLDYISITVYYTI